MTIKERLIFYLQQKKIGRNRFEAMAGISSGYITNLKNNPGAEHLVKILTAAPDLNRTWLLTGEGEMTKNGDNVEKETSPVISTTSGRPYYNVDFLGGFDLIWNDQTVNPEYNIDFAPLNHDGVVWCNITGHSMEPQIGNGDIIALREVNDWQTFLTLGEVYAIVTSNDLRTVKIVKKGKDSNHFLLVPVNKEYDEQDIPKASITRVFSVLGCFKKF